MDWMGEQRSIGPCSATLRHAHGVAGCWRPAGHEDKHAGPCDSCFEAGEDAVLTWAEAREEWPV
jgi:hypothetical protein